ncbi:MAG TPA: hypothetical protein VG273_20320 [Bryobacteraceae bacterium]|nr:hypothetical protein [Bryobacteraceae bacterium]
MLCGICSGQNHIGEDARSLVARAVAADDHSDRLARDYTYKVRDEISEHDGSGNIKATHSTLNEILYIGGKRYFHPLEKDGKTLPPDRQRQEDQKLDRAVRDASRLTGAERDKRLSDAERERARQRSDFKDIPEAFDFKFQSDAVVSGRAAWQISATPRAAYRGKLHGILNNVEGTLWIDKADLNWVKFEADVLNPFRLGWFLARVDKGTHISYQMMRVNNEIWVPETVMLKASARLVLLKKLNVEQHVTFSDYRKFQSDSKIVSTDAEP